MKGEKQEMGSKEMREGARGGKPLEDSWKFIVRVRDERDGDNG